MPKSDRYSSLKYRIIGAITIFVLLIILLPIIFHNSEEEKLIEMSKSGGNLEALEGEFKSTITPLDESINDYKVDEISIDSLQQNASIPKPISNDEFIDQSVIEEVVIEDVIPVEPINEPSDIASEEFIDPIPLEESLGITKKEDVAKVTPVQESAPEPQNQDQLDEFIETQTGSNNNQFQPEDIAVGWIVQVGTFSETINAERLMNTLVKGGFQPQYKVVDTNGKRATRVWVGPYEKRVVASQALEKVAEVANVKPFIKSYPQ